MTEIDEAEDRWGEWVKARTAISFALEEEVRTGYELGATFAGADTALVEGASARLGDALGALLREIAARPPPTSLIPLRDALVAYLQWRQAVNDAMATALRRHGWQAAAAVLDREHDVGQPLYRAVIDTLQAIEQRRGRL